MTTETDAYFRWRQEDAPDYNDGLMALRNIETGQRLIVPEITADDLEPLLNALEACAAALEGVVSENSPDGMSLADYDAGESALARLRELREGTEAGG